MRRGVRSSGLVLTHGAVAVLVALAAVCAPAQAPPSASKPPKESAPPVFPKRFYTAPGGQFCVPAGVPVNLDMSLSGSAGTSGAAPNTAAGSNQSSVVLKEGPTSLSFGGIRVPVIADGTPPKTVLTVGGTTHVEVDGLRVLGPSPKLSLSASDALSGVAETLVSIDGAPFAPVPAGSLAMTGEGEHRLRYFSVDRVGNAEKVQEYAFRIDATPPQTKLDVSGPRADTVAGVGASLSLSATDAVSGVDEILYRLDDGAEQTYEKPLVLDELPEGPHHLEFYAVDRVGNREAPQNFAFVVDRTPPQISLSIHGPQYSSQGVRYVAPQAEIELTGLDAVAGPTPVRYSIDGGAATVYTAPFHLPLSVGIHRLRLESTDPVDNSAQLNVDDIYMDPAPPRTEVQFSRPFFVRNGDVVLNPASKIELNASDFGSGVESVTYSLDGAPEQKYTGPFSVTALGEHSLTVNAVDHVGNREPAQQLRLLVQQPGVGEAVPHVLDAKRFYQDPKLGLLAPPGLPFVVRISTSPDAGAQNYMLSSGPGQTETQAPPTFTTPGRNTVSVAISKKPEEFGILIDAAPPKTQLAATGAHRGEVGGVTYFGPGLKIALTSADDPKGVVSGLWKTLYSLDGSAFTTYTGPLNAFTREGPYTLRYYALDNVGNAETTHEFQFTVDTTPPETQLTLSGPHFASTVAHVTRVTLTATDNLSGVAAIQYSIDGGKILTYREPFAIGPLSVGPHRLSYFALDAAGNREEAHDLPFTVASPVSAASFEVRGKSVERGGTVFLAPGSVVLLKAAEGESVVYSLDGGAEQTYSTPIPAPKTGSERLSFHAVDELGIAGAGHTVNLAVDHTAPNSYLRFEGPQLTMGSATMISGATRIVLGANAGAVGGATLEYSLGGGHWQAYTGPFSIKYSGTFDLAYRARNPVSALGAVQRQRVIVDARGPAITVSYSEPVEGSASPVQLAPGTLMFISAEDTPAGLDKITYKLDDQPALIYRAPLSRFAPGKTHTVTIVAEDLLGNQTVKTVRVAVKEPAR
jgi:hypothetical protein